MKVIILKSVGWVGHVMFIMKYEMFVRFWVKNFIRKVKIKNPEIGIKTQGKWV